MIVNDSRTNNIENIYFNDIDFYEKSMITTTDMENVFINEKLFKTPLYKKIKIEENIRNYKFFPYNSLKLELYCNECKKRRIYSFMNSRNAFINMAPGVSTISSIKDELKKIDFFRLIAQADCGHHLVVDFRVIDNNYIEKIGQYPSIYDMNEEINNNQFLKLLDKEYVSYYKTACSLYSFNSCIGALTYLRRIFEQLLIDIFNDNKNKITIAFDEYKKMKMREKISKVKSYLPQIMQEQGFNTIYTKISDGIHNLTEEECSNIFPILKDGIEEILINRLEEKDKEKRRKEISTKLNNL